MMGFCTIAINEHSKSVYKELGRMFEKSKHGLKFYHKKLINQSLFLP